MIKRRFFKVDRGDVSDSSSSSSDSEADNLESDRGEEEAKSEKEDEKSLSSIPGSGYESEDSSRNDLEYNSSDIIINEDDLNRNVLKDSETIRPADQNFGKATEFTLSKSKSKASNGNDFVKGEFPDYVLKSKSVFKCRLCPRIVCLNEDTIKAHLKSKRHARSEKLLNEGRLKMMLNSDGEIEDETETHAERHARTIAIAEVPTRIKKQNRERHHQRENLKKKQGKRSKPDDSKKLKIPLKKEKGSDIPEDAKTLKNHSKRRRKMKD